VQIPFGKYRGTSVTELPFDYLQWLTSIDLLDPLRAEVKKEYGARLCDQRQYEGLIDLEVIDEIISAGVRSLARTHHPDAGGDHDKMVAINNAADWLRERARN
jgi:hypothetical protein